MWYAYNQAVKHGQKRSEIKKIIYRYFASFFDLSWKINPTVLTVYANTPEDTKVMQIT